jgi:hypothetical protein
MVPESLPYGTLSIEFSLSRLKVYQGLQKIIKNILWKAVSTSSRLFTRGSAISFADFEVCRFVDTNQKQQSADSGFACKYKVLRGTIQRTIPER